MHEQYGIADDETAPASIQAIFRDIRDVTRSPVVNLVFRRLATNERLLGTAWSALRPLYLDGILVASGDALIERISKHLDLAQDASVTCDGRLPASDLASLRAVTRTYLTNNARNLVAFRSLLGGAGKSGAIALPGLRAPDESGGFNELPPLPRFAQLPDATKAAIRRLNSYGDTDPPRDLASFFVHLSYWPHYLAKVEHRMAHVSRTEDFCALRQRTLTYANDLASTLSPDGALSQDEMQALANAIGSLVSVTIPKMIPICLVVRRMLGC